MAYKLKTDIAHRTNYGLKRAVSKIEYIVIHYTANDGDTDEANANYFNGANRKASAHYFVDDDSVTQSVKDNYVAWSVGGSRYSNYKTTGGAKYYKKATNTNTISIELCDDRKNGTIYPSAKTIENAIELTKDLMEKYNIPASKVIRHFDVTGKPCPAYWCGTASKNKKWETEFHDKLTKAKVKITLAGAIKDEDGNYKGGEAGDQLQTSDTNDRKGEVRFRDFHIHAKGWYGFIFVIDEHADRFIQEVKDGVNNPFVGYDQGERYDIMDMAKKYGSLKDIAEPTECVCSSLFRAAIYLATGIDLGPFLTGDMPGLFKKSGLFEPMIDVNSEDDVEDGMILVTRTSGHTEAVVSGRPRKKKSAFKSYKVKITTGVLNVRAGAGTSYKVKTCVKKGQIYTIVDEKKVGSDTWGLLKSGQEKRDKWISLKYTKKA